MHNKVRKITMDHKVTKLLRKVRLSVSIDGDALKLLERMAIQERRSVSGEMNTIIYDAAKAKGFALPGPASQKMEDGVPW